MLTLTFLFSGVWAKSLVAISLSFCHLLLLLNISFAVSGASLPIAIPSTPWIVSQHVVIKDDDLQASGQGLIDRSSVNLILDRR